MVQRCRIIFREEGISVILKHPERIYKADETAFLLCPKTGEILGPKSVKDVHHIVKNNEKEQITVMGCFSANGETVPQMIIYPYKRLPREVVKTVPNRLAIGLSENGWINSEVFFNPSLITSIITYQITAFKDLTKLKML